MSLSRCLERQRPPTHPGLVERHRALDAVSVVVELVDDGHIARPIRAIADLGDTAAVNITLVVAALGLLDDGEGSQPIDDVAVPVANLPIEVVDAIDLDERLAVGRLLLSARAPAHQHPKNQHFPHCPMVAVGVAGGNPERTFRHKTRRNTKCMK